MQVCLKVLVNIYLIYKTDIKTCFDHSIMIRGRQCDTDSQETDSVLQTVKRQTVCYRQSRDRQCATDSQEADSVLQTVKRQTVCYRQSRDRQCVTDSQEADSVL